MSPRFRPFRPGAICDQHGILLVIDEIQTGFGRTGRLFALEHHGVEADPVTMAKSLAGGFPLSALTGRCEVMAGAVVAAGAEAAPSRTASRAPASGLGAENAAHPASY